MSDEMTKLMLERTKKFALRVLSLAEALPKTVTGRTISSQLARSATSVAANYRAAQRARSRAEFIAKVTICQEEADETLFWIELLEEAKVLDAKRLEALKDESDQLVAIIVSSLKTTKQRH